MAFRRAFTGYQCFARCSYLGCNKSMHRLNDSECQCENVDIILMEKAKYNIIINACRVDSRLCACPLNTTTVNSNRTRSHGDIVTSLEQLWSVQPMHERINIIICHSVLCQCCTLSRTHIKSKCDKITLVVSINYTARNKFIII